MAKLYGQIRGRGANVVARCANDSIKSSVQSYDGSIITTLWYKGTTPMVSVEYAVGSAFEGKTLFSGSLAEYVKKLEA